MFSHGQVCVPQGWYPVPMAIISVEGQTCLQDRACSSEAEKEPAENTEIN